MSINWQVTHNGSTVLHVPGVVGATVVGETAEAAGVTGVVGAWEEEELDLGAPPDEGVAAADWLRELKRKTYVCIIFLHMCNDSGDVNGCWCECVVFCLTWMRSCWWRVLRCPASWQVLVLLELPDLLRQRETRQKGTKLISLLKEQRSSWYVAKERKRIWICEMRFQH